MKSIIFNVFCILISVDASLIFEQDNVESLTSCVVKLVEDINYKKYSNIMDITFMNMNYDLNLSALHKVEGARFITRRFFWEPANISNVIYIVMSNNYQELQHGLSKVTSDKFWNPTAVFIIVLQSYESYSLHDVTDLLHAYNIFYQVSLINRQADDYAIYKYNFTKPQYCVKSGHLTFWSWCSDYHTEKSLPLIHKGSIRNCRYKFVTRNLWPFTNFDTSSKGSEQHFLSLFERQYGVKIDLQEFGKVDKYGKLMYNLSTIMVQKVGNNEYEGAVGGYAIDEDNRYKNVSYSYPVLIDHDFYILAHANFVDQWVALLHQSPITCTVVGLLFVTFWVSAIFLSIFPAGKGVSYNALTVLGYLLNKNYVRRINSGWSQTLMFSSLLFTAFIIPYAIQANLFSVTTQPVRGYEPREPQDLDNYYPVLYSEWHYRSEFADYWDCGTRFNCLDTVKKSRRKNLYTIISDAHYHIYQWRLADDQCEMTTYRLREPFSSIYRTIFLRRGSALLPYLDHFILQISTTGIMHKFGRDVSSREWLKCKSHYRPEHVPLPLSNFYHIFMILAGGYCLSLMIFIYEIWSGSQRKLLPRAHP